MRSREELLGFLGRALAAERSGGYRNRAVMGGLGKLLDTVAAWEQEAGGPCVLPSKLTAGLAAYARSTASVRERTVQTFEAWLAGKGVTKGGAPDPEPRRRSSIAKQPEGPVNRSSLVTRLRGVKEERAKLLAKLGIRTVGELLALLPVRYEDRSVTTPIAALEPGSRFSVRARVQKAKRVAMGPRRERLEVTLSDGDSELASVWFNQPWIAEKVKPGAEALFHGPIRERDGRLEMTSPEVDAIPPGTGQEKASRPRLVPVYPLTEGLHQRSIWGMIQSALASCGPEMEETLPPGLVRRLGLPSSVDALAEVHAPSGAAPPARSIEAASSPPVCRTEAASSLPARSNEAEPSPPVRPEPRACEGVEGPESYPERILPSSKPLSRAWHRLRFEELYFLELAVAVKRQLFTAARAGVAIEESRDLMSRFRQRLPFELTGAQERAIGEILTDMRRPRAMARLVQGDVGSGKTVVALAALIASAGGGYQGALMAPTEILAGQHYLSIRRACQELGVRVELLVGSQGTAERRKAVEAVASGECAIAVGTHALIEGTVEFARLGLVVIDEQHRFGVNQRARLKLKGSNPNLLVMTATPIPRTLSLTLYGDLDISVLDEMPPGRHPIVTRAIPMKRVSHVYERIRCEVEAGRQAYVVCPLVEESETLQVEAAESTYEELRSGGLQGLRLRLLHGRMTGQEKSAAMETMRAGEADVLVSTTVVEVGVDIPNATVMAVLNAERFGLAQLHQLRGRVGRGGHASWFHPVIGTSSERVAERMEVLEETADGFLVAERDMQLRGAGEIFGTRQSGLDCLRVAELPRDLALLETARREAFALVESDPTLESVAATRSALMARYGEFVNRRH